MTLSDANLNELIAQLSDRERRAVERHVRGERTDLSRELLRRIKASLKRKARAKLPRRLVWLA
jgi:hypothetical protein